MNISEFVQGLQRQIITEILSRNYTAILRICHKILRSNFMQLCSVV